jgi:hypothetical protein
VVCCSKGDKGLTSVLLIMSSCQGSEQLQVLSPAAELSDTLAEVLLPQAMHHVCLLPGVLVDTRVKTATAQAGQDVADCSVPLSVGEIRSHTSTMLWGGWGAPRCGWYPASSAIRAVTWVYLIQFVATRTVQAAWTS